MTTYDELNRDADIDLSGIFASVWRNKFKLLVLSLIVTVLAFFVLQVISPRYRSEAHILIRASGGVLERESNRTSNNEQLQLDERGIASKVELLKSRNIADKVIENLELKKYREFDSELDSGLITGVLNVLGLGEDANSTAEDRVIDTYYDNLKVYQAERSRVIIVSFSSKDPELAAAIPNMIADEYVALQRELKKGAAPAELKKMQDELVLLNASVKADEAAMADFRNEKDLQLGANNNTLATQELSELATELGRARSQLSQAQSNAASVQRALETGALEAAPRVLQSQLIQRLRERQVNLRTQLSDLSTTLLSGHPRIRRIQSQLNTLENQITNEAEKIEASLQQEVRVAQERIDALLQNRAELKSEAGRVGKESVELQDMERELVAKRELLSQYSVRLKEAESRQSRKFSPVDAFIFSNAQVPSKAYFPKKGPILAGVFFGTFLMGAMITLAGTILSLAPVAGTSSASGLAQHSGPTNEAMRPQDGSNVVKSPPLVPIQANLAPHSPLHQNDEMPVVLQGNVNVVANSLKMLGHGRIAVLTPDNQTGSAAVVLLARNLVKQGASAILVDATTGGQASKIMLGGHDSNGVKDILAQKCSVADAIHYDRGGSPVHVMPIGKTSQNQASQGAERLPTILDALQRTYNYVIIDCGDADINGLEHVSDVDTITVVNTADSASPHAQMVSQMLVRSGHVEPLFIVASPRERSAVERQSA